MPSGKERRSRKRTETRCMLSSRPPEGREERPWEGQHWPVLAEQTRKPSDNQTNALVEERPLMRDSCRESSYLPHSTPLGPLYNNGKTAGLDFPIFIFSVRST